MRCTFDGACEPRNPGGAIAWAFTAGDYRQSGFVSARPENTNNVAEYYALLGLLRHLGNIGKSSGVEIFGDSELVIKQVNGECRVHNEKLKECYFRVQERVAWLEDFFGGCVSIRWHPREQNTEADALTVAELAKHGVRRTR